MKEVWRDVPEFPDLFMVSTLGRVWSKRSKRILSQGTSKSGYKVISTKIGGRNGKAICRKVHRWVAEAFIENPQDKPQVNHKDGNKVNNRHKNLEWCINKENSIHAKETGLLSPTKGTNKVNCKLTDDDIRFIRNNYKPRCKEYGSRALARKFGVNHKRIYEIMNNLSWRHVE